MIINNTLSKCNFEVQCNQREEELGKVFSKNCEYLFEKYKNSQKKYNSEEFLNLLGIGSTTTLKNYINGITTPNIKFLCAMQTMFPDYSYEDFLNKDIEKYEREKEEKDKRKNDISKDRRILNVEDYYGVYILYYLDSNSKNNVDAESNTQKIKKGVLYIVPDNDVLSPDSRCSCIGLFNLENEEIQKRFFNFSGEEHYDEIEDSLLNEGNINFYNGFITFNQNSIFINLMNKYGKHDQISMIYYRPMSNNFDYYGGIGIMNAISGGLEQTPVSQMICISRYDLCISEQEIVEFLQYPYDIKNNDISIETSILRDYAKQLYIKSDNLMSGWEDDFKDFMLDSLIRKCIEKIYKRNVLSFTKLDLKKDNDLYEIIKDSKAKASEDYTNGNKKI